MPHQCVPYSCQPTTTLAWGAPPLKPTPKSLPLWCLAAVGARTEPAQTKPAVKYATAVTAHHHRPQPCWVGPATVSVPAFHPFVNWPDHCCFRFESVSGCRLHGPCGLHLRLPLPQHQRRSPHHRPLLLCWEPQRPGKQGGRAQAPGPQVAWWRGPDRCHRGEALLVCRKQPWHSLSAPPWNSRSQQTLCVCNVSLARALLAPITGSWVWGGQNWGPQGADGQDGGVRLPAGPSPWRLDCLPKSVCTSVDVDSPQFRHFKRILKHTRSFQIKAHGATRPDAVRTNAESRLESTPPCLCCSSRAAMEWSRELETALVAFADETCYDWNQVSLQMQQR